MHDQNGTPVDPANVGNCAGAITRNLVMGTPLAPRVVRETRDLMMALFDASRVLDEANAPHGHRRFRLPDNAYIRRMGDVDGFAGFRVLPCTTGGYGVRECCFDVDGTSNPNWRGVMVLDFKDPHPAAPAQPTMGEPLEMAAREAYGVYRHSCNTDQKYVCNMVEWERQDEFVRERFRKVAAAVLDGMGVDPRGIDPEPAVPHDIGWAMRQVRESRAVRRSAWAEGVTVFYIGQNPSLEGYGTGLPTDDYLCMRTARETIQPGWTPQPEDLLAGDWELGPTRGTRHERAAAAGRPLRPGEAQCRVRAGGGV